MEIRCFLADVFATLQNVLSECHRSQPLRTLGHNMTEIYAWYGVLSSPQQDIGNPLKIYDMPYMLLYPDPPSTHFFVLSFSRVPRNIWYLLLKKARGRGRGVLAQACFFFPQESPISKDETPICCRPSSLHPIVQFLRVLYINLENVCLAGATQEHLRKMYKIHLKKTQCFPWVFSPE